MPTPLADLPSNKPIPNGKVQIKRGAEGSVQVSNLVPYGTRLSDGAGGSYEISYTPTYPCFWIIRANVMAVGDNGGWQRWDYRINITPADADGRTACFTAPTELYDSGTVSWRTFASGGRFRLNAGIAYTVFLTHSYSSGYYQRYHTNGQYTRLIGRIVGEGAT
jgi:hypothetical protein